MSNLVHIPNDRTLKGLTRTQKSILIRFVRLVKAEVDRQGGYFEFPPYAEFVEDYLAQKSVPFR